MNNQRIIAGVRHIKKKKILILFPAAYISLMILLMFLLNKLLQKMGEPYSGKVFEIVLYIFIVELIIIGLIGIIQLFGMPLSSRKVANALINIDFVDNEGKPPLLISKKKDGKGIVYEFYSSSIALNQYKNHFAEFETALNIRIVDVLSGSDKRHTIIKAVNGNDIEPELIVWNDKYLSDKDFELILGESYFGIERIDISSTPHVLIGGGSGSGKTKLLKLILMEARKKNAIIFLADFKGGVDYPAIWHKACYIITEPEALDKQLEKVLEILEIRRKMFVEAGTPNISEYNKKTGSNLCRIIIACDEVAEILDTTGFDKEKKSLAGKIEGKFSTIARLGRAFGLHLIFATQRPSSDVINGQIKNNIGYRICGRADHILSQIILDNAEASEKIAANDQGMFLTNTGTLFKAYYVEDNCFESIEFERKLNIENMLVK